MKSLRRLIPFLFPYRFQVMAGFSTFFVARFFEISTIWAVAKGIDVIGQRLKGLEPEYSLAQISFAIVASVVFRMLFVIHARRAVRRVAIAVSYDLRQRLYTSVQQQGHDFFARLGVGDIMTRAIQDISLIQRLCAFGAFMFVIMVYAPFFAVIGMLSKSITMTLLILPTMPLIFLYAKHIARFLSISSLAVQERLSELASHVQENLSGIRTVQAQAQEANEIKRFWLTNDAYGSAFYEQAKINSLMMAWMPFFASCAQLLIIIYGGTLVLENKMSVGDLIFFLACLGMLLQPIRMAGMFVTIVQRAAVATDRLYEIYDAKPEIQETPSNQTPTVIKGEFEIRNLNFVYPRTDVNTLKDISLHIKAGESIGIVGRVGSGKSTLLKQFTRMLNTPKGTLFVDGHDVCDYPLSQLRSQIAQVLQDPFLFGEPLKNNISYDDPERELELIWDSADAAALKETIENFPHQMQTLVGERGVTLSGGQKQRATLARGLIRNAPVLILDDCFSSVDTETEEHILSRLKAIRGGKTTILVSHRVSTLRHSDRIIVLEEGRIVEEGSHEALIRLDGNYAALERAQTQGAGNE
ncbi:MAG: ABC transporter ATP-binding protein [Pseudomonadales bacterium]|nr:ABC transporter ATP-binding protein [Pseudomonadales bacterium]